MRGFWVLPALVLLLLATASPVLADHAPRELEVSDQTIETPIEPLGEPGRTTLEVRVPCQDDEQATAWTTASLIEAPSYITMTTPSMTNRTTEVCHDANDTLVLAYPVEIAVDQRAPAFETQELPVEIRVQKNHTNGTVEHLGPAEATVTVTPGYFNLYNVRLEQKIGQAGPQEAVTYPIVIDNYSNGDTRFVFSLANPDNVPSGFQPVVPEPLVLQSNATGGERTSGTVKFQIYTPFHNGYVNEIGAVQLEVTSAFASDTDIEGEASYVSTLTQARGWYVPGPSPLVVLLAVVVALGLARRWDR